MLDAFKMSLLTQSAHDIPGTYVEGPLKVLTSGTYRGPSGDSRGTNTKINDLTKKLFLEAIALVLLFLFFIRRTHFQDF